MESKAQKAETQEILSEIQGYLASSNRHEVMRAIDAPISAQKKLMTLAKEDFFVDIYNRCKQESSTIQNFVLKHASVLDDEYTDEGCLYIIYRDAISERVITDRFNVEHKMMLLFEYFSLKKNLSRKSQESQKPDTEMETEVEDIRLFIEDLFLKTRDLVAKQAHEPKQTEKEQVQKGAEQQTQINDDIIHEDEESVTKKIQNGEYIKLSELGKALGISQKAVDLHRKRGKLKDFSTPLCAPDYFSIERAKKVLLEQCYFCGKHFIPENTKMDSLIFCSPECRKNHKKTLKEKFKFDTISEQGALKTEIKEVENMEPEELVREFGDLD